MNDPRHRGAGKWLSGDQWSACALCFAPCFSFLAIQPRRCCPQLDISHTSLLLQSEYPVRLDEQSRIHRNLKKDILSYINKNNAHIYRLFINENNNNNNGDNNTNAYFRTSLGLLVSSGRGNVRRGFSGLLDLDKGTRLKGPNQCQGCCCAASDSLAFRIPLRHFTTKMAHIA